MKIFKRPYTRLSFDMVHIRPPSYVLRSTCRCITDVIGKWDEIIGFNVLNYKCTKNLSVLMSRFKIKEKRGRKT